MMAFCDKNAPTEVVTDMSPVRLGAILVQEQHGVQIAVAFANRSLMRVDTVRQKRRHWQSSGVVRDLVFIYQG